MMRRLALVTWVALLLGCTDRTDRVDGVQFDDCHSSPHPLRCQSNAPIGSIGPGPSWSGNEAVLGGGFIEGTRLVVAVRSAAEYDVAGSVFAIDLASGERSLVSGIRQDARLGAEPVGDGPALNMITDVQAYAGRWYASTSAGIIAIDPSTGDRNLWFDAVRHPGCSSLSLAGIAIGPTGMLYTAGHLDDGSAAVVAIRDGVCFPISSGHEGYGRGPDLDDPRWFVVRGFMLYVADPGSRSILAVDTTTGDRVRVSSANPMNVVGAGDADIGDSPLTPTDDGFWTSDGNGIPVQVDVASGDRNPLALASGPARAPIVRSSGAVWPYPAGPLLVTAADAGAAVINSLTGESNWLSR